LSETGEYQGAIRDWIEAIRLDPNNGSAYYNIAWLRATCPDERSRNGPEAVEYARQACNLSNWKSAKRLDILAAAYAENGDFPSAMEWQQKAIELVPENAKQDYAERLELYRSSKPYRNIPKK
jgi:tetratricopeptide (TPR) repeat protein